MLNIDPTTLKTTHILRLDVGKWDVSWEYNKQIIPLTVQKYILYMGI